MKLTQQTLTALKNFSSISPSLIFPKGNTLRVISPDKDIIAATEVDVTFNRSFAVADLSRFLGVLSLFKEPDIDFESNEHWCVIANGKTRTKYVYAEPSLVLKAPEKDIVIPSPEIKFEISVAALNEVLKAATVMALPTVSVIGDGETMILRAHDRKNDTSDEYSLELGDVDTKFNFDFKTDRFKFVDGVYQVEISSKKIAKFTGNNGFRYWLAPEASSKFEG